MGRDRDSEGKKAGKRDLRTPIVDPLTRESKGRYARGVLLPKFPQYAPGACSQILNRLNIVSILRGGNSAPKDEVYP